ncbi:hypothetical protein VP1G_08951 [Cytospora mali]|uniref:Uncharacterized protein n=1 Tax=Cytospora mali TaxID=578113 RepID=A0A194VD46_CYTMA|nr:hypothetical protein VP1G_08951 [Valsa mali var. pyri (nom. inval.)]
MESKKGQFALLPSPTPPSAFVLDSISNSDHNVNANPLPAPSPSASPPHAHPPPPSSIPLSHPGDQEISPRHEILELIPEDRSLDTLHTESLASPSTAGLAKSSSPSNVTTRTSGPSTPETGIIRPTVRRPPLHSLPSRASSRSPTSPLSPIEPPLSPAIFRTASTHSVLRHPAPDSTVNARSGSYTSNIAALEATAERFSMTSSIEDAIRNAHEELKRTDSRRSSILAASVRSAGDFSGVDSPPGIAPAPLFARKSSIVGLNNEARLGGYSPGGFIMSPAQSLSERLTSGSKSSGALSRANSTRSKAETIEGEAFPNLSAMSRSGPGKSSIHSARSNRSGQLSLAEIAEMEPPSTLTHAAMDEADRGALKLHDLGDDDETILSRAHQHVEPNATDIEVAEDLTARDSEDWARAPILDHSADSYWDQHEEPDTQPRFPQNPPSAKIRDEYEPPVEQRQNADSPDTDDEDNAFADFDGMHCDPETVAGQFPILPEEAEYPPTRQRESQTPARPQSYFDPATGQNMLYYPARVPAMLNLPPKLGKGLKFAQRNMRRSQVLSQMPQTARESRTWLPDPLEGQGEGFLDLMGDVRPASSVHSSSKGQDPEYALAALEGPGPSLQLVNPDPAHSQAARKPRMNLSELPPQLRASVFFDLPAEAPKIEVKDGSATKTLDSILDAAASAPVNAFTDHAFAGRLGPEVYGLEKKKNRKSKMLTADDTEGGSQGKANKLVKSAASTPAVPEAEKRKSVWSLLAGRKSRSSVNLLAEKDGDARSKLSGSARNDSNSGSDVDERSALAPDDVERDSDMGSENEEQVYSGPPTTLLAELQLRKQRQKDRTRNPLNNRSDGLHSTLLELDAVAQVEAQARKSKHVNLAWAADLDEAESDDDEDVPLGLLAAKKQTGPNATDRDMALAAQEMNRPLGLMEKRDLDDNEPLSQRRNRLQGKEVPVSMYLQPGGNSTRMSRIGGADRSLSPRLLRGISPAASNNGSHSQAGSTASQNKIDEEVEGETLGDRMRRLRAKEDGDNPLPRARPVSMAFSTELMTELGINGAGEKDKGKGEENAVPQAEEEETLGQRRRRLQAERQAREAEMGIRAVSGGSERGGMKSRLSMADVLGANPLEGPQGRMDPREAERLRKEEEAARVGREQAAKMAAFRAQVPQRLHEPGTGVQKAGGFQGGRFNDSTGGHGLDIGQSQGHHLRGSMSMGQLGQVHSRQVLKGMGGMDTWASRGATNLVGAAGNYGNMQAGPDGMNSAFSKGNTFGRGYGGGLLQQAQGQQQGPFVSGSLLGNGGGYGAFGGGIGAAGGYASNQTVYGAGVGLTGGMASGYGMQTGVPRQAEHVERWRQGIR